MLAFLIAASLALLITEHEADWREGLPPEHRERIEAMLSGDEDPFQADLAAWRFGDEDERAAFEAVDAAAGEAHRIEFARRQSERGLPDGATTMGCPPVTLMAVGAARHAASLGQNADELMRHAARMDVTYEQWRSDYANIDGLADGQGQSWSRYRDLSQATDDPLLRELFERVARDQFTRITSGQHAQQAFPDDPDLHEALARRIFLEVCRVDFDNTAWLKGIVEERGWFTNSADGENAPEAAWLIAQHADHDTNFQRHVLDLLEPLANAGEVSGQNYAYLSDRIAMNLAVPQRFGTQGSCGEDGRWGPRPIADEDAVDELRARYGLEPLSDYVGRFNEMGVCG